jgi:glycine cleavage system P protein (glycine dehydrogenase)
MTTMTDPVSPPHIPESPAAPGSVLHPTDTFVHRHIGPDEAEVAQMLAVVGAASLDELITQTIPDSIRMEGDLDLGDARGEHELIAELRVMAKQNQVFRSYIGMGYCGTITPPVILRNVLENPGWYTQYTPYQAEISQGRLEALLNFQTMIADLTALPLAGASLLDEATAAAEAMAMCHSIAKHKKPRFLVADDCHPQTIAVVQTRGEAVGVAIDVVKTDAMADALAQGDVCGLLVQYPTTDGRVENYHALATGAHAAGALIVAAADLLALTLIVPPGEWGADIAVGSAQRFGVPMGFGGPHAGYIATHEKHVRKMPGRIIGVSRDAMGNPALRMAIQTREQHIKRDRATSNICTAQALLAVIASFYGVYHGPDGLRAIANRVRVMTNALRDGIEGAGGKSGHIVTPGPVFDTLRITPDGATGSAQTLLEDARQRRINLRDFGDGSVGVTLDETTDASALRDLLTLFGVDVDDATVEALAQEAAAKAYNHGTARTTDFMTHPVFNTHHCETELLRYMKKLENRDLSLAHSMIPLGSCTMKLNGTSEMLPVTWPEFAHMHPFAPREQWEGYAQLFDALEKQLAEITGFAAVSLQPNAGSQGEFAGLLAIKAFLKDKEVSSESHPTRNICLIPTSAHGTNPASAIVAGMKVVAVKCDERGNIDVADLRDKARAHKDDLAALMVTYPSTHGVFEASIREICDIIHDHGGQVYMDGANMNAQVGLCRPGDIGADVCHLNLHKTFCIPHGGGGPGVGPIGVAKHLVPFLPSHPFLQSPLRKQGVTNDPNTHPPVGPVAAAPFGSASILPISYVYIALMGAAGLTRASQIAILSANYMAKRLEAHYDVLYTGENGRVAHEFIIDCRAFDKSAGVKIDDIAKRLIDYGFHAPTMSFPVPGTLMIEPTESEPLAELDRFCDALIAIRAEIAKVERGDWPKDDNPLTNAPHTIAAIGADEWPHPYTREEAAYPAPWLRDNKFWSSVSRIDNPHGDRNLICACISVDEASE